MAHVLVVGGTGMLREVSLFLAKHDNTVSVIALEQEDLLKLKSDADAFGGRINPIQVDYRDYLLFGQCVQKAMETHGPITLAISWMQTDALPEAANTLVDVLTKYSPVCRYFQVLPSSGITGKDRRFLDNPFPHLSRILYRKIILGFDWMLGTRRWLQKEDIASGVIKAIRDDMKDLVIGMVEPPNASDRAQTA